MLKKEFSEKESSSIKFDRVRIVLIDLEGFMTCSCGYVQRMLMPCRHICSVIDKVENYVPSLFHIRWHKLFNYYYSKNANDSICSKTTDALEAMLFCTREHSYHLSGRYKGIFIKNTPFMKSLEPFISSRDSVNELMDFIMHETRSRGALISNSYNCDQIINADNTVDEHDEQYLTCQIQDFGGNSITSTQFSQEHDIYAGDVPSNTSKVQNNYYKEGLGVYEEMMKTCPNIHEFNQCIEAMTSRHFSHIAMKGINSSIGRKGFTTVLGENRTSNKNVERHMTVAEQILKKSKLN